MNSIKFFLVGHSHQHDDQFHYIPKFFQADFCFVNDVGSSFLKLLAFLKVILICAERKIMLNNDIKSIGPCACFFARLVQRYEI